MIQDLGQYKFDNTYRNDKVEDEDYIFIFNNDDVYMEHKDNLLIIPKYKNLKNIISIENLVYLFKIENHKFYLLNNVNYSKVDYLEKNKVNLFRTLKPSWMAFAGVTAKHLYDWYNSNRYCGRCGASLEKFNKERALICNRCNNLIYPTIAPAIIVGIINDDKILLTKYSSGNNKNYSLVAGYVEIGECVESTIKREVMEEVGLKVKNIRYYGSQPWGFSNTLLLGYFAELDGSDTVTLEEDELSEATWFKHDDIPEPNSLISLTSTMIKEFKNKLID